MTSLKRNDGPQITLDSKADKYARHLLGYDLDDSARPGLMRTIEYLGEHAIDRELVVKYGLGFVNPAEPADYRFSGMLAIPYFTRAGVVWMKYRCTLGHDCKEYANSGHPEHSKYSAAASEEPWIYNPEAFFTAMLSDDGTIGVAEGEMDAIVATEKLGVPSIGIPGVEIWVQNRKIWRRTLDDYDNVLIFVDGDRPTPAHPDGAGLEFARKVADDVGPKARLVRCPEGEDVASMVASGQGDILRERAGL